MFVETHTQHTFESPKEKKKKKKKKKKKNGSDGVPRRGEERVRGERGAHRARAWRRRWVRVEVFALATQRGNREVLRENAKELIESV